MRKKVQKNLWNLFAFTKSSQAIFFLTTELILGITIILTSLFAFANLAKDTFIDKEITLFDTTVSQIIQALRTPFSNDLMQFISFLGADFTLFITTAFCILLFWKNHKKESFIFIITLVFGALLNLLLKELFQRPRPEINSLLEISSYSFPSGHAMNAFVFYATFAYFTFHFTKNFRLSLLVTLSCGILILLIGASRVYLGVHYPSDVVAGYIAGLFWFMFVLVVERTFIFFKLFLHFKEKRK